MTNTRPQEQFNISLGMGKGHITYSDYGHCFFFKQIVGRTPKGKEVYGKRYRITKAEYESARNF